MNLATLRVHGTDQALHSLCGQLGLVVDSTWKKGDARRRGGCFATSGFVATLVDAGNRSELLRVVREFAARCDREGIVLASPSLSVELSIGVSVGDTEQFVAVVEFSSSDLQAFATLGVSLSIAAYPTSDEANETPSDS